MPPRVLMLRYEPASYTLARGRVLEEIWPGKLDTVFMFRDKTQNWSVDIPDAYTFLPANPLAAVVAISRHIRQTQPALLHVAGWSAAPSLAAILISHARGLPVVVDLDTWRGTPSHWRGAVKQLVYPKLFRKVTHFAPGGAKQAAYLRGFGVPDEKISPIHMTVDVASIRRYLASNPNAGQRFREHFGIATDVPMALFIGRLVPLKGISDLLDAWPRVTSRVDGMQLVIAGDGAERDRVAGAAARDPTIHPVGRLSGNDVWSAYAAADFVVAPSHYENWGLVANEAMAAGAPIIVTDIFGCVDDLVQDGKTALLVPARSPARLAEAMSLLALDRALRHRLARAAGELVSEWTIENEAEKIIKIWMRALGIHGHEEVDIP